MALYTILFGISIFMIALVMTIIKKMYFHWKKEHKIERMTITTVDRPTVSVIISMDKCLLRRRRYAQDIAVYDVITRSDTSLPQVPISMSLPDKLLSEVKTGTVLQSLLALESGLAKFGMRQIRYTEDIVKSNLKSLKMLYSATRTKGSVQTSTT